jgi:hypothetical protein
MKAAIAQIDTSALRHNLELVLIGFVVIFSILMSYFSVFPFLIILLSLLPDL